MLQTVIRKMSLLTSWLWLVISLVPLIVLERWIHRHLQGVWLLLVRDADLALILYSLLMLPGVLVHEASHWVAATLLGVKAGRFSVVPERLPDDTAPGLRGDRARRPAA